MSGLRASQSMTSLSCCTRKAVMSRAAWCIALSWTYARFHPKRPSPREANHQREPDVVLAGEGSILHHQFSPPTMVDGTPYSVWGAMGTTRGLETHTYQSLSLTDPSWWMAPHTLTEGPWVPPAAWKHTPISLSPWLIHHGGWHPILWLRGHGYHPRLGNTHLSVSLRAWSTMVDGTPYSDWGAMGTIPGLETHTYQSLSLPDPPWWMAPHTLTEGWGDMGTIRGLETHTYQSLSLPAPPWWMAPHTLTEGPYIGNIRGLETHIYQSLSVPDPPCWMAPHTQTEGPWVPSAAWKHTSISLSPWLIHHGGWHPILWLRGHGYHPRLGNTHLSVSLRAWSTMVDGTPYSDWGAMGTIRGLETHTYQSHSLPDPPWWMAPHTLTEGPWVPSAAWKHTSISLSPCLIHHGGWHPILWLRGEGPWVPSAAWKRTPISLSPCLLHHGGWHPILWLRGHGYHPRPGNTHLSVSLRAWSTMVDGTAYSDWGTMGTIRGLETHIYQSLSLTNPSWWMAPHTLTKGPWVTSAAWKHTPISLSPCLIHHGGWHPILRLRGHGYHPRLGNTHLSVSLRAWSTMVDCTPYSDWGAMGTIRGLETHIYQSLSLPDPLWWMAPHTLTKGPWVLSAAWKHTSISLSPCLLRTRARPSLSNSRKRHWSLKTRWLQYRRFHQLCANHAAWIENTLERVPRLK